MYDLRHTLRTKGQPTARTHVTNVEHTWVCIKVLNWYPQKRHMSTVHREEIVLIWNNCSSHVHHDKKQDSFIKDNILTNRQYHLPRNKKGTGTQRRVVKTAGNVLVGKEDTGEVSHPQFLLSFELHTGQCPTSRGFGFYVATFCPPWPFDLEMEALPSLRAPVPPDSHPRIYQASVNADMILYCSPE